jgi:hypothetical protein
VNLQCREQTVISCRAEQVSGGLSGVRFWKLNNAGFPTLRLKHSHCTIPERMFVILEVIASPKERSHFNNVPNSCSYPKLFLTKSNWKSLSELQELCPSLCDVNGETSGEWFPVHTEYWSVYLLFRGKSKSKSKSKIKAVLLHAMESHGGRGGIAPTHS